MIDSNTCFSDVSVLDQIRKAALDVIPPHGASGAGGAFSFSSAVAATVPVAPQAFPQFSQSSTSSGGLFGQTSIFPHASPQQQQLNSQNLFGNNATANTPSSFGTPGKPTYTCFA